MKTASPSLSVAAAVFAAAVFAVTAVAQAPQTQPSTPPAGAPMGEPHHEMPAPTNLQVLPKDLTGEQVHRIMHSWASALGTRCDTCHAPDPNAPVGAGGHPRLDYALDTKPEKNTARLMVKMVEDINGNYIGKIDNAGIKVSCGTCHRGHLSPPIFMPPPEHHMGPPPGTAPAGAPAPAPAPGL